MDCEEMIRQELLRILNEPVGVAGTPLCVVERKLRAYISELSPDCSTDQIHRVIQKGLDEWVIDKTIDELTDTQKIEMDILLSDVFTWHLKILSNEEANAYRNLDSKGQALIRLLREQNDTKWLGEISRDEATGILADQGFEDPEHAYAGSNVEEFSTFYKGSSESIWCYGIKKEFEKTEEYQQWQEELAEKAMEEELRGMRLAREDNLTGPIYEHLEEMARKRDEQMCAFWGPDEEVSEEDWAIKAKELEERDAEEEATWESIIDRIQDLPDDDLENLRKLLKKRMLQQSAILRFLEEKGV